MDLIAQVRSVLTDDLLKPIYRNMANRKPTTGHCYAASEAIYHMLSGCKPMQINHEGGSHWYLLGPSGEVLDATADQFSTPVPYNLGKGKGFLTKAPSKRATEIIRRVQNG